MKIIMVAVISRDGFITKGTDSDVSKWSSTEDKEFFKDIKSKHSLFVMGRKTFDSGAVIPIPNTLKVVLTTNLELYKSKKLAGQLEFKNLNPKQFVTLYESSYKSCLLLGGGYTYSQFLEADLVDEIYLTVEPFNLEKGTLLLANGMKLIKFTKNNNNPKTLILNRSGTLLQHYVLKK